MNKMQPFDNNEKTSHQTTVPLISVITACFNANEYIEQCMQSVIGQSFDDFEYIVIDGGSTDGTRDMIEKYQKHLAYWHSKPDRGVSHAFNQGLEQVNGQWVIFLNSDDYFSDSEVLMKLSSVLEKNKEKDVVFGQFQRVSRENQAQSIEPPYGCEFQWGEYLKQNTIPHPSSFSNINFINRVGSFDESYKVAMDYEFYLRGGEQLSAIFYPEMVTCMREGGMSRAHRYVALNECFRALKQHNACSSLFILLYGTYLRLRFFARCCLVKFHVMPE